ncbi:MAG: PLP-dependent cysteine synthase family protein, partial [Acidimicrobiales bacterium]
MDVLVVVADCPVPERLAARARRRVDVEAGPVHPDTIADLRAHIPRSVGVFGDPSTLAAVAHSLHEAGLPVTVYSDDAVQVDHGIEVDPVHDPGAPMEAAGSLLDLIGRTPLVRMDRVGRDLPCQLLGKLEAFNPGGSIKDRAALSMVEAAEADGSLLPGGTIIEPTSGNTGVGLALVAARRGYRCIFTVAEKVAEEKRQLLRAYGAEVVICPSVPHDHPDSYT